MEQLCCFCDEPALLKCSKCTTGGRATFYCSPAHQRIHWLVHKHQCGLPQGSFVQPPLTESEVSLFAHKLVRCYEAGQITFPNIYEFVPENLKPLMLEIGRDHDYKNTDLTFTIYNERENSWPKWEQSTARLAIRTLNLLGALHPFAQAPISPDSIKYRAYSQLPTYSAKLISKHPSLFTSVTNDLQLVTLNLISVLDYRLLTEGMTLKMPVPMTLVRRVEKASGEAMKKDKQGIFKEQIEKSLTLVRGMIEATFRGEKDEIKEY